MVKICSLLPWSARPGSVSVHLYTTQKHFFLYGNKEALAYGQASYRSGPSILAEEIKILTNIIS